MNHNDDHKPKTVPVGLIASEVLKNAEPAPSPEVPSAADDLLAPSFPRPDPNYKEPTTVAEFKVRAAYVGSHAVEASDVIGEQEGLIRDLIARVESLEGALMPFATHAMMLANMAMCLAGAGRQGEPAGGTWTNGVQGAQLQANANIFYIAADVIGRHAAEQRVMDIFNKIQEAHKAAMERDAHVSDRRLQGPIGGPISGQTQ